MLSVDAVQYIIGVVIEAFTELYPNDLGIVDHLYYSKYEEAKRKFVNGKCALFILLLKKILPNAKYYMDKNEGHLYLCYNNEFYDAYGYHNLRSKVNDLYEGNDTTLNTLIPTDIADLTRKLQNVTNYALKLLEEQNEYLSNKLMEERKMNDEKQRLILEKEKLEQEKRIATLLETYNPLDEPDFGKKVALDEEFVSEEVENYSRLLKSPIFKSVFDEK